MGYRIEIPADEGFLMELGNGYLPLDKIELCNFLKEVNTIAYKMYEDKSIVANNEEHYFYWMIFGEMHKNFQSVIIMLSCGLMESAETLLRRLYELSFKMSAIDKNGAEAILQLKEDYKCELGKFQKKIINKHPGLEYFNQRKYFEYDYRNKYTDKKIYEWAKDSGREDEYNIAYKTLCDKSHASLLAIQSSVKIIDKNERVLSFIPQFDDFDLIGTDAIRLIIYALVILRDKLNLNSFSKEMEKELNEKNEKFEK